MPKFETPPRFCPIHTKIHVCDEMSITNQVKSAEDEIGARARRLQGLQTEEEMMAEAAKAEANAAKTKGGIGDILAKAKARIAETKKEASNKEINEQTKEVSQDEVNDRMAALRARMSGGGGSSAGSGDIPAAKSGSTGGLGEIIEHAREISKETWSEYKVPERSHLGETPLPVSKNKSNSPTEDKIVEKSKKSTPKPKNADKMPSIALDTLDLGPDEDDLDYLNEVAQNAPKKAPAKASIKEGYFTVEQTQELIQEAVKTALKEVGLVKPKKVTPKKAPEKASPTKKPAAKAPSSAKKPATKTTTTKKSTSSKAK